MFVILMVDDEMHSPGHPAVTELKEQFIDYLGGRIASSGFEVRTLQVPAEYKVGATTIPSRVNRLEPEDYDSFIEQLAQSCHDQVQGATGWSICCDLNFHGHMRGGVDMLKRLANRHAATAASCSYAIIFTKFPDQRENCDRELENTVWKAKFTVADRLGERVPAWRLLESLINQTGSSLPQP